MQLNARRLPLALLSLTVGQTFVNKLRGQVGIFRLTTFLQLPFGLQGFFEKAKTNWTPTLLMLILLGLSKGSKDKMIVGLMLNDHGSQKSNETGKSHANDML
ncbi:hypothetical protein Tco_0713476 [Tanacetum coccineum]